MEIQEINEEKKEDNKDTDIKVVKDKINNNSEIIYNKEKFKSQIIL